MALMTRGLGTLLLLSALLGALLLLVGCGEDADVALDVAVEGEPRAAVSGSIVGVTGPLSLSLNGGETVTITQSGSFAFSGGVFQAAPVQITVSGQPSFGHCVVKNGDHPSVTGDIVVRVACIAAGAIQDALNLDLATATVGTTAGNGSPAYADAVGTLAAFNSPFGAATDGERLWIADTVNNRIRQVDLASGTVSTVAGDGTVGVLNSPQGVTTDGERLWIADSNNNRIRQLDLASGALTTVLTGLSNPVDLTSDGQFVFIVEQAASQIRRLDPTTGVAPVIASVFSAPSSITHDGTWLYVVDSGNADVQRVNPATGVGTSLVTGLTFPSGAATDGTSLYTSDTGTSRILKTVLATGVTTLLAGTGATGAVDGPAATALFTFPYKTVPVGGRLYITDSANNVVRDIQE